MYGMVEYWNDGVVERIAKLDCEEIAARNASAF
jgi:hypothetical protein